MSALEAAVAQNQPRKTVARDVPPMAEINAAIDELEEAMKKHELQKAQSPRIPPADQKQL